MWYDEYKVYTPYPDYVYLDEDKAYIVFEKVIEPRNGGLRWCYYIYKNGKYKQIARKNLRTIKRAKEKYPEYFI